MAMLVRRYRLKLASRLPVVPTPAITLTPQGPIMVRAQRRGRSRFASSSAVLAPV